MENYLPVDSCLMGHQGCHIAPSEFEILNKFLRLEDSCVAKFCMCRSMNPKPSKVLDTREVTLFHLYSRFYTKS
jgi:hypothetical protein